MKKVRRKVSDIGTYNKTEINEKIQEAYNKNTAKKYQNGWWICGDTGLIIQWAHYTHHTGTHYFQLPMKFPNAGLFCLGYVASALDYDNDGQSQSAQLIDNSTVKVTIDNGLKTAVLAIGY